MECFEVHRASFRDNSGFIFNWQGSLYRQVNASFSGEYEAYISSGLHQALVDKGFIVDHDEVELNGFSGPNHHKVIKPTLIPYLTYPYEWSFSQLQDAAKLTLEIQLLALQFGFTLKDASAFNIQFHQGRPILIDTLSFISYQKGPWLAYRQFCQHFLAPLLLKKYCDHRLGRMSELYIDGLPLDLTSQLLPIKTWFSFNAVSHIHLHSRAQSHYSASGGHGSERMESASVKMDSAKLGALTSNLLNYVSKLQVKADKTEWANYYGNTNYATDAMQGKVDLIESYLKNIAGKIQLLADLGANNGYFSRLASQYADNVVSFDIDEFAVEQNYLTVKAGDNKNVLPVVLDLFNPSASIGWANEERDSFVSRGKFEVVIALALIHHLAISNNVPLKKIVHLLSQMVTGWLIIEFVPKTDSQVEHMLATREDIFTDYHEQGFEQVLTGYFTIKNKDKVPNSDRTLYCLQKVNS
ncbi:class I SAM-dependent methyltransferase [Shewanella sp. 4_MG-2023]|uniref:class I SAM-dependent methyltransferase n=1 Tax=Shewanella sp. 4_MG-2023 TaxID=3062652 RepID=UPI0026E44932|nr:class I SAM-dependent methyltransferase [Shewanella sp. 4_MG-2023]MDO6677544.1 class I SAM-dependent methyltransferase [Shewanella sp. 4_MG-2023]